MGYSDKIRIKIFNQLPEKREKRQSVRANVRLLYAAVTLK